MRNKKVIPAAVALTVALCMGASPAWAYFTDTHQAGGSMKITAPKTHIEEYYGSGVKHVIIKNEDVSNVPVYVRAKVFGAEELNVTVEGSNWSGPDGDGWYLYGDAVQPNGETTELLVNIDLGKLPVSNKAEAEGYVDGDNFNVVVIYEAVPVPGDSTGPESVDWSKASTSSEGGE